MLALSAFVNSSEIFLMQSYFIYLASNYFDSGMLFFISQYLW